MDAFAEENVSDPTDFPPDVDAPGLRSLDEAMRCTMCRELFKAPVTVNCNHGHCFCSLCIREYIPAKPECPLCRQPILEVHLRRNPVVEDLVKSWKAARSFILELLVEQQRPATPSTPPIRSATPSSFPSPSKKRRRKSDASDDEIVEIAGPSKAQYATTSASASSLSNFQVLTPKPPATPLVQCPICSRKMTEDIINRHLDNNCQPLSIRPSSPKKRKLQTQEWSRLFKNETASSSKSKGKSKQLLEMDLDLAEPLPKMAYDTVATKTIRERLAEYALPTEGEKPVLAARHQRWVTLFNANLDASKSERKTLQQLRKELRKWEENEHAQKARRSQQHDLDANAYEKDNKLVFAQLVEQARPRGPKQTPAVRVAGKSSRTTEAHDVVRNLPPLNQDIAIHSPVERLSPSL